MLQDLLVKIYNDLNTLDDSKLTLVSYENNTLVYRQFNKIIMLSNINLFYLPKKNFRYGLLTQGQLIKLRSELINIVQHNKLNDQTALIVPIELGFQEMTLVDGFNGPQITGECNLVGITNRLLTNILMKFTSGESRLLLKLIKKRK